MGLPEAGEVSLGAECILARRAVTDDAAGRKAWAHEWDLSPTPIFGEVPLIPIRWPWDR